jgi:hypothetical protein
VEAGFPAIDGAGGFGLFVVGRGGLPDAECAAVPSDVGCGFFQGFADSTGVAMPGKTGVGLAVVELATAGTFAGAPVEGTCLIAGGGRRLGGGGGVSVDLGFGGTSSK